MSRQLRPAPRCLNCGHETQSRYCSECGQENTTYRVSLGRLLGDLFEELFQLESRLWRSLWDLVRHPGRLTREYNAGRRVRYTSPLRLYLLASVTYFFTVAVLPPTASSINLQLSPKDAAKLKTLPPPKNVIEKRIRERLGMIDKLDLVDASRRAREILVANTPRVMAILVPIFALLLMMLFWRRYYVEHLVFALHAHAFAFLLLTLALLPRRAGLGNWATLVAIGWTLVALHNVYQQSWLRVSWKALLLTLLYGLAVGVGLSVAMLGGLLLF